jgi:hypothetical protein
MLLLSKIFLNFRNCLFNVEEGVQNIFLHNIKFEDDTNTFLIPKNCKLWMNNCHYIGEIFIKKKETYINVKENENNSVFITDIYLDQFEINKNENYFNQTFHN